MSNKPATDKKPVAIKQAGEEPEDDFADFDEYVMGGAELAADKLKSSGKAETDKADDKLKFTVYYRHDNHKARSQTEAW